MGEIVTDAECLSFMGLESKGIFTITAANDKMILTSDQGGPATIDIPDDTYEGAGLATALATAMNANSTLTGGAITFAVSYSSSTFFFTIDATVGHTIALTYSGSDAALTLGFSADFSATQTITSDTIVPTDPSDIVAKIHAGVEKKVLWYCDRDAFDDNTYIHSRYDGDSGGSLWLKNWPVTDLVQVSIALDEAIKIKNTDTTATRAVVNVDVADQEMTLTVTGGDSASSETIDLSDEDYDTLAELVAYINTLDNGWEAEIYDSDLDSILSTELVEKKGLRCGSRANTTASWAYLYIPDPLNDVDCIEDIGELIYSSGFPSGTGNVYVTYTGGFSTMPDDLVEAVLRWTKIAYDRIEESGDGLDTLSEGSLSVKYLADIPDVVANILDNYKRIVGVVIV